MVDSVSIGAGDASSNARRERSNASSRSASIRSFSSASAEARSNASIPALRATFDFAGGSLSRVPVSAAETSVPRVVDPLVVDPRVVVDESFGTAEDGVTCEADLGDETCAAGEEAAEDVFEEAAEDGAGAELECPVDSGTAADVRSAGKESDGAGVLRCAPLAPAG